MPDKPAAIQAAVSALLSSPSFTAVPTTKPPKEMTAEQQVRHYVDNGPGFLRDYIDVKVDFGLSAPITPREWDGKEWTRTEHPAAWGAFDKIRGPQGQDVQGLTAMMIDEAEQLGKFGLALAESPTGLVTWVLALGQGEYYEVKPAGGRRKQGDDRGSLVWPLRRGAKFTEQAWKKQEQSSEPAEFVGFPRDDVQQVFMGSARYPGQADLPLGPVLADIRRFVNASRALHRATASQLLLANLLWFQGHAKDIADLATGLTNGTADRAGFSILAQQLLMLIEAGGRSMEDLDDMDMISIMPYLMVGDGAPPEVVEVGRIIDEAVLSVKEDALKDIARGLSIPQDYILNGPGSGQRLFNQKQLDPAARARSIKYTKLAAEGLTEVVYRPILKTVPYLRGKKVTDFALMPDTTRLEEGEQPELKDLIELFRLGLITGDGLLEKAHMSGHKLERPEEISEYEHWRTVTGNSRRAMGSFLSPFLN